MNRIGSESLAELYLDAKSALLGLGYSHELDWQADVRLDNLTESAFLEEAAWVILSSGFRESRVRAAFPHISRAFLFWRSARQIVIMREACVASALRGFNSRSKIDAIAMVAERVDEVGFSRFRGQIRRDGVVFLARLPFIGPITSLHLAKNIGLHVVKPDRHLVRISKLAGFKDPRELCEEIARTVGDSLAVIDLVLWRIEVESPTYWRGRLSSLRQGPPR